MSHSPHPHPPHAPQQNKPKWNPLREAKKLGNPVSKQTQAVGKRIGGSQRAEFARAQKRRDSRR